LSEEGGDGEGFVVFAKIVGVVIAGVGTIT